MNLIFAICFILAQAVFALEKVTLAEGDTWTHPASGSLWVEDGEIVNAKELAGKFLFKGLKSGQSEIKIGTKQIIIYVVSRQQSRTYENLGSLIRKTLGLTLHQESGQIKIKGELHRLADWEKIAETCRSMRCDYLMAAKIGAGLRSSMQKYFSQQLRSIVAFPYLLEFGENITLHLPVKFPQILKIQKLASRYGVMVSEDSTAIDMQPMVKVQITVAEVKRAEAMKYGISWPDAYNAQVIPKMQASDSLTVTLSAMEKTGFGKILASPNILCRSGKEAEFIAGGEFPIKVINRKSQDIIWKKYGILLRIKPMADYSGRMSIAIESVISSIDGSRTVDGIPGLYTNRLQSHFDLTSPQTIALSGLLKHEDSEAQSGFPGLANLPVIGRLFSSKDFLTNKTELVIFVRPEIIDFNPETAPEGQEI